MTSGKDSMKNDFNSGDVKISIPPTILYSMVAKMEDVRKTVTSDFKQAGDLIYQVGKTYDELGGSEFYQLFDELGKNVPEVRMQDAKKIYKKMMQANDEQLLESAHDISDGGLAVALTESAFTKGLGIEVSKPANSELTEIAWLFAESHSRFVVSVKSENKEKLVQLFQKDCCYLGKVTQNGNIKITNNNKKLIDKPVSQLKQAWDKGLNR
jgi:phosphoribosylformylglycinamidine synthase